MTSFRTKLSIQASDNHLSHQSLCWSVGSCFAENIGQRLLDDQFSLVLNPTGIIYNPISIAQTLEFVLTGSPLTQSDLFEHEGRWHSFQHHGSFSHTNPDQCLSQINQRLAHAHADLTQLDTVLLTLGTAQGVRAIASGKVVANCHRLPNQQFERERLSPKQIVSALSPVLQKLKAAAPKTEVLLTVSPVRYLRDGLIASNRSKASLLLAVDALTEQLDFVSYFPAYELVMDDLRDYRFFDTDMAHPSPTAIDYVYERFQQTYMSDKTLQLTAQLRQLKQAMAHRPVDPASAQHHQFKAQQRAKLEELGSQHPYLDLKEEMEYFEH